MVGLDESEEIWIKFLIPKWKIGIEAFWSNLEDKRNTFTFDFSFKFRKTSLNRRKSVTFPFEVLLHFALLHETPIYHSTMNKSIIYKKKGK